jgi:2-dehydropantoate 2-reductase
VSLSPTSTVAVVGAGAVGITLAVGLAEAGHPIVLCGGKPLHRLTLVEDGQARSHPVMWAATPDEVGTVPWVILATKSQQVEATVPWLLGISDADTCVVVAQNGVNHRARLPEELRANAAPALVYAFAERTAPGVAVLRRADRELVLPDDRAGRHAAELFADSWITVELEKDFRTAAWRKLLNNAFANPITALTQRRLEVLCEPAAAALGEQLLREAATVGRAEGAALPDDVVTQTLRMARGFPPDGTSSMLQDRLAGRPLEHAALTGTIVELAARHGIPVPTSRTVLALLELISSAVRPEVAKAPA